MFGVSLGIRVGNTSILGGGFDADAQAYFDRVTTAGGTLTTTEKTAVNQLVIDLKANSLWTPMKAIYPMVGSSAAACAQNLKSSSFTGTFTSGWTFASTGVTPNGTSAYFNTALVPSTQLTQDSTHLSFYSRTDISGTQQEIGTQATNPDRFNLELRYSGNLSSDQYNFLTGRVNVANANSTGFYVASRTNSSTHKVFKNSSQIGTTNTTISGTLSLMTNALFIGAANGSANYSTKECAFASIGDGLTDTQASNFYTLVQIFQTTLSRNV
jgi:hypothetical protein